MTALGGWQNLGEAAVLAPMVTLLRALAGGSDELAATVPRAGQGDPDATLLGLLELQRGRSPIRARPATSRDLERNLALLLLKDVIAASTSSGRSWPPRR